MDGTERDIVTKTVRDFTKRLFSKLRRNNVHVLVFVHDPMDGKVTLNGNVDREDAIMMVKGFLAGPVDTQH